MSPTDFTPLAGAIGGVLIGASAILLLATAGRIAGASFIFSGLFTTRFDENFSWKALFNIGLLIGASVAGLFWFDPATIAFPSGPALTALSGLIVGVGVTLGNGCTSGHGICGMASMQLPSILAVLIFLATGMLTAHLVRAVGGV